MDADMDGPGAPLPAAETLFEHAACGLVVADVKGTIRRANATFCAWLGYSAGELVGLRRIQDLLTIGGRVFHQTHLAPLLQMQGSVAEVQLDMRHRDGQALPMLFNTVRRRHAGVSYDEFAVFIATDRRKYERELLLARKNAEASLADLRVTRNALEESRNVLGIAMRGAKMGLWSRELATDRIWWSSELEALAGLEEGAFPRTGQAFYALIHPDDQPGLRRAVGEAQANARDCIVEFRLRHASGIWKPMEARLRLAGDHDGKPVTLFGIAIDITDRIEAESTVMRQSVQLRALNEQLSTADRRKDEFLATLAHELRNPLAPMRNVLEILKLKTQGDPQVQWAHEVFARQVQHMTHLVDDLMEISRITQGRLALRKQPTDIAQVMRNAAEAARDAVRAGSHRLSVSLPREPIVLDADATRLTQILLNLLNNAAKYTPDGGQIWLSGTRAGEQLLLSVRDSGIGIAPENLEKVFDMFSQLEPALDRAQGGLGIGLALVRGLVQLHGGSVSARSEGIGHGSQFVISLPLGADQRASAPHSEAPMSMSEQGLRVLVIDDNVDAADSLAMALEMLGYQVRTAYDGTSGLALAPAFRPDVVLLDIGLPGMNGYQVAAAIRSQPWGRGMFLVAATGWGQARDKEASQMAGFDRHLTKPIDFHELDAILRNVG